MLKKILLATIESINELDRKGAMIGRGSLGTVMRLHNEQTKEEVVMKHVKQSGSNSASSLESTLQRLISLRSETLLPYLSYDRHDDGFDVFMSFWDKKTLGKHVERQEKNGVKLTEGVCHFESHLSLSRAVHLVEQCMDIIPFSSFADL
ncbi:hypothetical protein BLNAU_14325 [Blattamonas nauphoetae]|uniref:Protein kinase domain-containing protein n=1 Tax=Blattamonas nauphoetae TaxID=2049346 RepID=A0ABQ9WLN4_9EUKA|nr:hypothetical protein BLNAU_24726 [Blattamonas nauphoetae]KAK2950654.1 hypothetical protein BLNAU_14325 [Blattamonas nauphoetae]